MLWAPPPTGSRPRGHPPRLLHIAGPAAPRPVNKGPIGFPASPGADEKPGRLWGWVFRVGQQESRAGNATVGTQRKHTSR